MPRTQTKNIEAAIWDRLLAPENHTMSSEVARAIVKIDFPELDKKRMRQLADKARKGILTAEEHEEIESYGNIGSFISIMKSRARLALQKCQRNGSRP
jgi:hypothetical protein